MELETSYLSTPAKFVLRSANAGIGSVIEICRFLGMSEGDVVGVAAELLKAGLIVQRADREIEITETGRTVVVDGGRTLRPRNRHPRVPYDPLTKGLVGIRIDDLLDREEVRKQGLFVAPIGPRKPRLGNIRLAEVKNYERSFGGTRGNAEILQVSAMKDVKLRYRRDVVLVRMVSRNSEEELYAAYRAQQFLEDETAAIEGLMRRGIAFMPVEAHPATEGGNVVVRAADARERDLLKKINELDRAVDGRAQAVSDAEAAQQETLDREDRADMEREIARLRQAERELLLGLAEKQRELSELSDGCVRWIRTEEHRPLLLEAVSTAESELTIVSAWVGSSGLDDELCTALAGAVDRGVTVRIAWGLGTRHGPDADRNRSRGEGAIKDLRRRIRGNSPEKLVVKRTETHEKFVVCDERFCAIGSFNWLSYQGRRDRGYRREASFYSERKEDIELCRHNARSLFGQKGATANG